MTMPIQDDELVRLCSEISARLRHVCSHMTDDDFDTMVRSIAENQLRQARRPWKGTDT
jgi:hypothetical protein